MAKDGGVEMARKRFVTSDMSIDEKIADIAAENPVAALMWPWFIIGNRFACKACLAREEDGVK